MMLPIACNTADVRPKWKLKDDVVVRQSPTVLSLGDLIFSSERSLINVSHLCILEQACILLHITICYLGCTG